LIANDIFLAKTKQNVHTGYLKSVAHAIYSVKFAKSLMMAKLLQICKAYKEEKNMAVIVRRQQKNQVTTKI